MIDEGQARALVEQEIADFGNDPRSPWTPVIKRVESFERGWIVYYGPRERDVRLAGNAPFIVDNSTGELFPTGTAAPVAEYVANYLRTGNPHG